MLCGGSFMGKEEESNHRWRLSMVQPDMILCLLPCLPAGGSQRVHHNEPRCGHGNGQLFAPLLLAPVLPAMLAPRLEGTLKLTGKAWPGTLPHIAFVATPSAHPSQVTLVVLSCPSRLRQAAGRGCPNGSGAAHSCPECAVNVRQHTSCLTAVTTCVPQALFRPITVVVPDRQLIMENMLMAEGFVTGAGWGAARVRSTV